MTTSTTQPPGPRLASGPSTARLVVGGLIVAILGGAAALALALATGAVHTSPGTTIVRSAPAAPGSDSASGTWRGVYGAADAGVVDLTVQIVASVQTPFGVQQQEETAIGSGFVVDGGGDIITAEHVVSDATTINVTFADGISRRAAVLGRDRTSDVALIHVDPHGLTLRPLALGSSSTLRIGDPIAVVGDPLGFARSLSTGVVSALDRTIQSPNGFQIAHAIQTDAAMNPGNSGGPVLDARGQVVGIADQIAVGTNRFGGPSGSETSTGVGFAVPVDLIRGELAQLRTGQAVQHAYLGISLSQTADGSRGALVTAVSSGGPSARAGLRNGDVIVGFGAARIDSEGELIAALAGARPGQEVKLSVRRGASRVTIAVTLGVQPVRAPSS